MKYKAIIFDLNGVFIHGQLLSERFEQDFGIVEGEFLPALKKVLSEVRLPNAKPVHECWLPYLQKWGIDMDEQKFLDYWFTAEDMTSLVGLAQELKDQGYKLFILSNNFKERADYYTRTFLFISEIFEKTYYSWQTGFVKPDIEAYKYILDDQGLKSEECVYFDDSSTNIEAAKSLGINAFVFKDADDVREKLN